jgi:hypothetical protein
VNELGVARVRRRRAAPSTPVTFRIKKQIEEVWSFEIQNSNAEN